ncbi:glycosyltransferase [Paracoccus laeviglucosivorans]|uniref:Rhamnosyl transferase n=1 Tax=Paracoccus laeviglucosivorans TaxID=1197861 RepID=A0A521B017_9RHOB|nr:glycosyltransferase [Paracoccus laeviglucosivorans]SMO40396.1 Putative rhamnosyl transferase [Paracoccus laeviglucosivorans]
MKVVGVCRFSLIGRGDWKDYQNKDEAEIAAAIRQRAEMLFAPKRIEQRLKTFELLTLASLKAQTDQDFQFIVLASQLMPPAYRKRLNALCAEVPQVVLRYFDLSTAPDAQRQVFTELGLEMPKVVQFRLDDDDCLCREYVEILRSALAEIPETDEPVAASVRGVLYSVTDGPLTGVYHWPAEYFSAGAALRGAGRSIYEFGHFALGRRFKSVVIEDHMSLATNSGVNDTNITPHLVKKRGMELLSADEMENAVITHFPFLTDDALAVAGLIDSEPEGPLPEEVIPAPAWYTNLANSAYRRGFYIAEDEFALQFTQRATERLYVSFDNLSDARASTTMRDPWGYAFAQKRDWSHLGVMAFRENWYRSEELFNELERLAAKDFFSRFKQVIFSGTSMGGYAACAFSSLAPGSTVIAFSPQSSLAKAVVPWEKRYSKGRKADWSGRYSDAATELHLAQKVWIFYDPLMAEDRLHAERMAGPNTVLLKTRRAGHFSAQFLRQMGELSSVVTKCVEGSLSEGQFYSTYRQAREYRRYLEQMVLHVIENGTLPSMRRLARALENMHKPQLLLTLQNAIRERNAVDADKITDTDLEGRSVSQIF